MEKEMKIIN